MKRPLVLGIAVLLGASWAAADATLVLKDGQVLRGAEARSEGDVVVLRLASGDALSFPAHLVAEIRIEQPTNSGETPPKGQANQTKKPGGRTASGLTVVEPRTLAGPAAKPPNAREQLEVLGAPAQFSRTGTSWRWTPRNDLPDTPVWDEFNTTQWTAPLLDPRWKPVPAFDPDVDVLASGRVQWPTPSIDPSWTPSDGFKRWETSAAASTPAETALAPPDFHPEPAARASRSSALPAPPMTPRACAEKLAARQIAAARAPELHLRAVPAERFASIPLALYEIEVVDTSATLRAVFSLANDKCRLVGGDLAGLLGVKLPNDQVALLGASNYNLALGDGVALTFESAQDRIAYALAVVTLTSPEVSGGRRADLTLLSTKAELQKLGARIPRKCAVAASKRKKDLRRAEDLFTAPTVAPKAGGHAVRFLTLSTATGELARHDVVVERTGHVTLSTEVIATHLGDHAD